jgi:hypothetical protein
VKEIEPTAEERESNRISRVRGVGPALNVTPGKTVRRKIADCSPQIKARTQGRYPGVLVLWEGGLCEGNHTGPYHIRVAMAGFEQVIVAVPPLGSGRSPYRAGMKHGPSRKMTEDANTSISAVAVLCVPAENKMLLRVFHNRYAAVPLSLPSLSSSEVIHYALRDDARGTTEWQKAL